MKTKFVRPGIVSALNDKRLRQPVLFFLSREYKLCLNLNEIFEIFGRSSI